MKPKTTSQIQILDKNVNQKVLVLEKQNSNPSSYEDDNCSTIKMSKFSSKLANGLTRIKYIIIR